MVARVPLARNAVESTCSDFMAQSQSSATLANIQHPTHPQQLSGGKMFRPIDQFPSLAIEEAAGTLDMDDVKVRVV